MSTVSHVADGATVKSADRTLAVLDLLAERGPLTFTQLHTELGLPKSSALNLLKTMTGRRYVRRDSSGRFTLGLRVWEIAETCTEVPDLRAVLRPLMEDLRDATEETVQAAVLEGVEAIYFEVCESKHPMKLAARVGARLPAHASGVGKALLSELDDNELRRRFESVHLQTLTRNTIPTVDALLAELERTRHRGYATDNEEFAIGLRCGAMAVHATARETPIAVSVAIPTPRYSARIAGQARARLAEVVATAAERLNGRTA